MGSGALEDTHVDHAIADLHLDLDGAIPPAFFRTPGSPPSLGSIGGGTQIVAHRWSGHPPTWFPPALPRPTPCRLHAKLPEFRTKLPRDLIDVFGKGVGAGFDPDGEIRSDPGP